MGNLIMAYLALGIESKGSGMSPHVHPLPLSTTSCLYRALHVVFGYEDLGWGRMLKVGARFGRMTFRKEKEMGIVRISRKQWCQGTAMKDRQTESSAD